jgi:PTS system ascorbate-specific IIA component
VSKPVAPATRPLTSLIPGDGIRLGVAATDWRDAIRQVGEVLVADGAVDPAYPAEMIAAVEELGPYIVIAPGIALAHARPSPAVHRAAIAIVVLATPVAFGHARHDPVRIVIGLAAPDDTSHLEGLATLATFLADETRLAALLAAPDPAAIRRLIAAHEGVTAP